MLDQVILGDIRDSVNPVDQNGGKFGVADSAETFAQRVAELGRELKGLDKRDASET